MTKMLTNYISGQVGARCLEAGAWGAYYNVLINLENIDDAPSKAKYMTVADELLKQAQKGCVTVLEAVDKRKKQGS